MLQSSDNSDPESDTDQKTVTPLDNNDTDHDPDPFQPQVGDTIEVFWPLDMNYYQGTVTDISDSGYHTVSYDDGDTEALLINNENWRFAQTAESNTITTLPALESNEQQSLE